MTVPSPATVLRNRKARLATPVTPTEVLRPIRPVTRVAYTSETGVANRALDRFRAAEQAVRDAKRTLEARCDEQDAALYAVLEATACGDKDEAAEAAYDAAYAASAEAHNRLNDAKDALERLS